VACFTSQLCGHQEQRPGASEVEVNTPRSIRAAQH
jgi:hypothetical protein